MVLLSYILRSLVCILIDYSRLIFLQYFILRESVRARSGVRTGAGPRIGGRPGSRTIHSGMIFGFDAFVLEFLFPEQHLLAALAEDRGPALRIWLLGT